MTKSRAVVQTRVPAVLLLLSLGAITCKIDPDAFRDTVSQNEEGTRFSWSEGYFRLELAATGQVTLNADETDVVALDESGSLTLIETDGPFVRSLLFTRTESGQIQREFQKDGAEIPLDAEALEWQRKTLPQAVRNTGFGGRERARSILEQQGPTALLEKIRELNTPLVRQIYLQELLQTESLDRDVLRSVLVEISKIDSTDPFIEAVESVTSQSLEDPSFTIDLIGVIGKGTRSSTRRRLYSRLPELRPIEQPGWLKLLGACADIQSSSEKAASLVDLSRKAPLNDREVAAGFAKAARSIYSTGSKARLVRELISTAEKAPERAILATQIITSVSSQSLRLELLIELCATLPDDGDATAALLTAIGELQLEHHQYAVLESLLHKPPSSDQLERIQQFTEETLGPGERRDKLEGEIRGLVATRRRPSP